MASALKRIVMHATASDKKMIAAKAKRLDIPVSELLRRGALAYRPEGDDDELAALADGAKGAAGRAGAALDRALDFIDASNRRIARMEARAAHARKAGERKAA